MRARKTLEAGTALDERVTVRYNEWAAHHLPPRGVVAAGLDDLPGVGRNIAGRIGEEWGWRFTNPNLFGQPPVFLVEERHGDWLKVKVPTRPAGQSGWVHVDEVDIRDEHRRMHLSLSERVLRVYHGEQEVFATPVVIGSGGSPTPTGRFHITHFEQPQNPAGAYGPLIAALSGYSDTLAEFDGGAPGLALHGTNRPELMGQARSNGCVRLTNDAIGALAQHVDAGVVIDIWP